MRKLIGLSVAGAGVVAAGWAQLAPAHAADMQAPQAQMQPPSGTYGTPPVESEAYPPPPVAYGYPPPPVAYGYPPPPPVAYYAYAPAPVLVGPYPYYWRGYGPRVAYGYGHFGHGFRRR
jgi:hypothetical protein